MALSDVQKASIVFESMQMRGFASNVLYEFPRRTNEGVLKFVKFI